MWAKTPGDQPRLGGQVGTAEKVSGQFEKPCRESHLKLPGPQNAQFIPVGVTSVSFA